MKNIVENGFFFIAGHGRGWSFSSRDLMQKFTRQQADNLLSDLSAQGKIRRIAHGMYDYPKYSNFLGKELSPDIDQVARAYARKFNWRIEISGDSALNYFGLSTQVPGTYIYLSDGASKSYDIMGTILKFKKSQLKNIGFKYSESSLIVQALNALGKEHITDNVIKKIREQIDPKKYEKILKDTQSSTVWIYESIKVICQKDNV
ncbi:MAG: DUF6088 family protein [Sulfuricurvum sp.]|nr:DUF6088 family protein [Sulfuricurvum sp.]